MSHETRPQLRQLADEKSNLTVPSVPADLYAAFLADRESPVATHYAQEWAERFNAGKHFQHADSTNTQRLLKLMMQPIDGTRRHFRPQHAVEAIKDVSETKHYEKDVIADLLEDTAEELRGDLSDD